MNISEEMIKYSISEIFIRSGEDIENLNKFISKGICDKLYHLQMCKYKRIKYKDVIMEINNDIEEKKVKLDILKDGDDLGSAHENYITEKYQCPVFVTHWPFEIKSFYMKQCDDGTCESFDLLMPYGIGELIGASQREDSHFKLLNAMKKKDVNEKSMEFYLDLRKYGSCPHGGFGLGFDRLLMLITGIANIKDVIPFPVFYKNCKY
jgi:asparaginyl-tRNA synthetase